MEEFLFLSHAAKERGGYSVKSNSAYGGLSTVAGTLIGFLTGMYLPIGELPKAVQTVMKCFPTTHASVLIRQVMCGVAVEKSFAGIPDELWATFEGHLGITLSLGGKAMQPWMHLGYLALAAAVCFGLSAWLISQNRKSA